MSDTPQCCSAMEGIPEIWRIVKRFPPYEVSNYGGFRRLGRIKKPIFNHRGYRMAYMYRGKALALHVLIAETFMGPRPEGKQVDHKDGNRAHNCAANLQYLTSRENTLRGKSLVARNSKATHCVNGHPFDEKNTRYGKGRNGYTRRACRACAKLKMRRLRASGLYVDNRRVAKEHARRKGGSDVVGGS